MVAAQHNGGPMPGGATVLTKTGMPVAGPDNEPGVVGTAEIEKRSP